jgi:DNA-binding NtrC family response regulator
MQRAAMIALADSIGCADLLLVPAPEPGRSADEAKAAASIPALRDEVDRYEAELIQRALMQTGGNHRAAAKLLRIPVRTLFRKLKDQRGAEGAEGGEL